MRFSDYFRLGRISVKSRKRSTRNTVVGIGFGLAVLIPVLFFTLAFHADLLAKVDARREMSIVSFNFSDSPDRVSTKNYMMKKATLDEIRKRPEAKEIIRSEYYSLGGRGRSFSFTIGDRQTYLGNLRLVYAPQNGIFTIPVAFDGQVRVIDAMAGDPLVPSGVLTGMGASSVFLAGTGFTKPRGEIILSEPLARGMGYSDPAAAVGESVSISVSGSFARINNGTFFEYRLDEDADPNNEFVESDPEKSTFDLEILHEFTVCGVVREAYYLQNSLTLQDAHIWLPSSSLLSESGESYLPVLRRGEGSMAVTYPDDLSALAERAAEEKVFFPLIPALTFSSFGGYAENTWTEPVASAMIQCKSFNDASDLFGIYEREYREDNSLPGFVVADEKSAVAGFSNLRLLNTVSNYILSVMTVFGGVVMLATLLNLFNTVNYSVEKRKNYMGMMQAIGARKSAIPKLYLVEIFLIFLLSFPWAFLFGGAISYVMKYLVDRFFASTKGQLAAAVFTKTISLNFGWFFLAFAIVAAAALAVSLLFSVLACRGVTRSKVMEVLATEQS